MTLCCTTVHKLWENKILWPTIKIFIAALLDGLQYTENLPEFGEFIWICALGTIQSKTDGHSNKNT